MKKKLQLERALAELKNRIATVDSTNTYQLAEITLQLHQYLKPRPSNVFEANDLFVVWLKLFVILCCKGEKVLLERIKRDWLLKMFFSLKKAHVFLTKENFSCKESAKPLQKIARILFLEGFTVIVVDGRLFFCGGNKGIPKNELWVEIREELFQPFFLQQKKRKNGSLPRGQLAKKKFKWFLDKGT